VRPPQRASGSEWAGRRRPTFHRSVRCGVGAVLLLASGTGCSFYGYPARHELMSDSKSQIWLSEESQVKVRNAQSRVFDTTDKRAMIEAIIATLQDIGFQLEVLDETLGIISAKRFLELERPGPYDVNFPTYLLYDEENLVVLNRNYRTWGPFEHRSDLVRLTVTIRRRNEAQLIVRASAQYYLRPLEDPESYQQFYAALEKNLLAERMAR
jgi:hypothetical protein